MCDLSGVSLREPELNRVEKLPVPDTANNVETITDRMLPASDDSSKNSEVTGPSVSKSQMILYQPSVCNGTGNENEVNRTSVC